MARHQVRFSTWAIHAIFFDWFVQPKTPKTLYKITNVIYTRIIDTVWDLLARWQFFVTRFEFGCLFRVWKRRPRGIYYRRIISYGIMALTIKSLKLCASIPFVYNSVMLSERRIGHSPGREIFWRNAVDRSLVVSFFVQVFSVKWSTRGEGFEKIRRS